MFSIRSKIIRVLLYLIGFAIFVTLIVVTGIFNSKSADRQLAEVLQTNYGQDDSWTGIKINCFITNINPPDYEYNVHLSFEPMGFLANMNETIGKTISSDIELFVDDNSFSFQDGEAIQSQDFSISFSEGDMNHYPFDVYTGDILITASLKDPSSNNTINIPLSLNMVGAVQGWKISQGFVDLDGDNTNLAITMRASRSPTAKAFSIYIVFIMWALSSCVFALAMTFHIQRKKIIPHSIGLCTGMLFALPNVRNTQPGTPPIGCTADVFGFFWNILLVAISGISLLLVYIYQNFYDQEVEDGNTEKIDSMSKQDDQFLKRSSVLSNSYASSISASIISSNDGSEVDGNRSRVGYKEKI